MGASITLKMGVRPLLVFELDGKEPIGVELGKTLNRRDLVKADDSYNILVRYLTKYKLEIEYYDRILSIYDNLVTTSDTKLIKQLDSLLSELFPDDKIEQFLTDEGYKSPATLMDVFDQNIILNKEGSREQTYTKTDYRELVILTIKVKAISIIIAKYIYTFEININTASIMKVYRIIDKLPSISRLNAYTKLNEFILKNIGGDELVSDTDISRILKKGIPNASFSTYILTNILLFLSISASSDNDDVGRNMVQDVFRLCRNKIAPNKSFMVNNPALSVDDDGSNAAVTDTYLSVSEIPVGYIEELLLMYGDRESISCQVSIPFDSKLLEEVDFLKDILHDRVMDKSQTAILCWLFFDVIESEYLQYFTREIIVEFRLLAYAILKSNGLESLANVMVSTVYDEDGIYVSKINSITASEEVEDALAGMYSVVSINKKPKTKKYGLSILDDTDDTDDDSIGELFIKPVVRRLSSIRWVSYHTENSGTPVAVINAREELGRLAMLVQKHLEG